jgi:hypothetical protein
MNIKVTISAPVHPTEVREKVETALKNIIPVELKLQDSGDSGSPGLYGEGDLESLRKLHFLFREEQILDTARGMLLNGIKGSTTEFRLSKQVAFVGKVNFPAGRESLGSIHVGITAGSYNELQRVIDWLTPQTINGESVEEIEL